MLLGPQTKILVVDDDQLIIDQIIPILNKLGVQNVDYALGEISAITALSNNMYDFLIVDLKMPENGGINLFNFINSHGNSTIRSTPLLALYGTISDIEVNLIGESFFIHTCKKPFTDDIFVEEFLKLMKCKPVDSIKSLPDQVDFEQACKAGMECVYRGDLKMARNFIEPKLLKEPHSPRLNTLMGQILFGEQNLDQADRLADNVLLTNRKHLPAINLKSKILVAKGSYDKAIEYMEMAQAISPLNTQRLIGMGEIHLACGRPKMALEKFERALKISPTCELALIGMAKVKIEMGELAEGAAYFSRLKDQGAAVSEINLRAVMLSRAGCFTESLVLYERAIKCCAVDSLLSKLYYNKAIAHIRAKKMGSAKDSLEDALAAYVDNTKAQVLLNKLNTNNVPKFKTTNGQESIVLSDRQKQLIYGTMHTAIKRVEE